MIAQTAGFRAAMLGVSWFVASAASGCVRQHSHAVPSYSSTRGDGLRGDAATGCVEAGSDTRVLDLASSSGHLAPQKIREVMQRQQASVSACFEASLERQAAFKGTVTLLFAIEPDGSVSHSSVIQSDLADCEVAQCLRSHLTSLSFPVPEGGAVMVQYPISFESQPLSGPVTAWSR